MDVNATLVRELRDKTGAGVMDCKKALAESKGDLEKAAVWLREKGIVQNIAKSSTATSLRVGMRNWTRFLVEAWSGEQTHS